MHLEAKRPALILDVDVECRPMAWYAGDWTTKEITAIAWRFIDFSADAEKHLNKLEAETKFWLLTPSRTWAEHVNKRRRGMELFLRDYAKADMVTGHYIRGFDLPLINATCARLGLPMLGGVLAHDTKNDLMRMHGLSKSQENLAAYFDMKHEKEKMNTHLWEVGNSLVAEGRHETKRRVVGDVNQHIEFRQSLLKSGYLNPPQYWSPAVGHSERYHP